jgi:hypothetical protein
MRREKAATQTQRNDRTSKTRIEGGHFWIFRGELILDTTPVSQSEEYGEAKGHPRGHLQHWTELQRTGAMSRDLEYDDPPRGRVVHFPKDKRFVLYVDPCILTRKNIVRRIMAEMNLPHNHTRISSDDHYRCLRCLRD